MSSVAAAAARVCTRGVISPPGVSHYFLLRNARAIRILPPPSCFNGFGPGGREPGRGRRGASRKTISLLCSSRNGWTPPSVNIAGVCVKFGRHNRNRKPPPDDGKDFFFSFNILQNAMCVVVVSVKRVRNGFCLQQLSVPSTRRDFNYNIIRFNPV